MLARSESMLGRTMLKLPKVINLHSLTLTDLEGQLKSTMIPTDSNFKEAVGSIFREEGYEAAVNFLYRRGYTNEDSQNYVRTNFVSDVAKNVLNDDEKRAQNMAHLDPCDLEYQGEEACKETVDENADITFVTQGLRIKAVQIDTDTHLSMPSKRKNPNFISRFFNLFKG